MSFNVRACGALVALLMGLLAISPGAPAQAATGSFPQVQESCNYGAYWPEKPTRQGQQCADFIDQVTLEPVNGGLRVSWTPGKDTTIRWDSCTGDSGQFADCPIERQTVFASKPAGPGTPDHTCVPATVEARSCTITGLQNGIQYGIRIRTDPRGARTDPYNGTWGYYSFESSETVVTASPCCSVAAPPSDVQATQVGAALDVTWAPSKNWGGATTLKYVVTTDPPSVTCTSEILTCRLEGLDYAKAYKVLVASKNDAGESAPVASAASYTIPTGPPDAPTISGVKFGVGRGAKVTWAPPAKNGGLPVARYTVTSQPGGATCSVPSGTSCTIAGLTAGKAYSFTATATNAKGTSKASAPSVAGKLSGPGVMVQAPTASTSGSTATVSWKPPAAKTGGALVSYVVKASGGAGTCTTKNTRCAISGLRPGGNYTFAVTTVRAGGASGSVSTAAVTMPAPPIPVAPKPTAELT